MTNAEDGRDGVTRTYWQGLADLASLPEAAAALSPEFAEGADLPPDAVSRRSFLALLSASIGLATTACRRPEERIVPFVRQPETTVDGVPSYYATTFALGASGYGLLVKTREGRPIKVEGNPDHPLSKGRSGAFAQASVLDLYDPDRLRGPLVSGKRATWEAFDAALQAGLAKARAERKAVRVLSSATSSPSLLRLLGEWGTSLGVDFKAVFYEPYDHAAVLEGARRSFGSALVPEFHLEKVRVLLACEADLIGPAFGERLDYAAAFARGRKAPCDGSEMSRVYAAEAAFSLLGSNADHRQRLPPGKQVEFLGVLLKLVTEAPREGRPANPESAFLARVAKDLLAHRGESLVVAGPELPAGAHMLVNAINSALGNHGKTVTWRSPRPGESQGLAAVAALLDELKAGRVGVLISAGGNPAYDLPGVLGFAEALKAVPTRVRVSRYDDETAALCELVAAQSHDLEAWGDAEPSPGIFGVVQPAILPLFDTRSLGDVLLRATATPGEPRDFHAYVMAHWQQRIVPRLNRTESFERIWESVLSDGVLVAPGTEPAAVNVEGRPSNAILSSDLPGNGLTLLTPLSPAVLDGRLANNVWMQGLPNPITKISWDNYASFSPATAKRLGIVDGDRVAISLGKASAEFPVHVQVGLADDVIVASAGYGRWRAGRVGTGVGVNVSPLRPFDRGELAGFVTGISVSKVAGSYRLANSQGHFRMSGGTPREPKPASPQAIVREATLPVYRKEPDFARKPDEHLELTTLYRPFDYPGHRWGMAIDMSACTGCSACVVACQAENNIPTVDREQVVKGREMHWIRIDRYYSGPAEDPEVVHQPMLCQHCENAPCENVCPVAATSHSPDGLNQMTYNRCVGTRYCSNNCPYKVRRFNFLDYHKPERGGALDPLPMVYNPDVTVRMRGIMEKCTFCVQRLEAAKWAAKRDGRLRVRDGEAVTACAQACPADAIVFGDLNDPSSRVARLAASELGYHVLSELNVKPSITYLAKLRNPEGAA